MSVVWHSYAQRFMHTPLDFIVNLWYNKNMRHRLVAFVFFCRPFSGDFFCSLKPKDLL
jgi:hypothetical protein